MVLEGTDKLCHSADRGIRSEHTSSCCSRGPGQTTQLSFNLAPSDAPGVDDQKPRLQHICIAGVAVNYTVRQ